MVPLVPSVVPLVPCVVPLVPCAVPLVPCVVPDGGDGEAGAREGLLLLWWAG